MAILPQTTIKTFYPAYNHLELGFIMTDLGTPPDAKWFSSYPANDADVRLTEKNESFHPIDGSTEFTRDLLPVIRTLVSTKIPTLTASQNDVDAIQSLKLKYGTVSFDGTSTPCSTTEDISDETDLFYILNAKLQQNELDYFDGTKPIVLQSRPPMWRLLPGQHDFFWLLGAGKVHLVFYDRSGTQAYEQTHDFSDPSNDYKVTVIGINPELYSLLSANISHVEIEVLTGGDISLQSFNIFFNHNTCIDTDYIGLIYLDSHTGRCALPLSVVEANDLILKNDEAEKQFNFESTTVSENGLTRINVNSRNKKTFSTQLTYSSANEQLIKNCLSSSGHHLQKYQGSNAIFEKCLLESGTYKIYQKNKIIAVNITVIMGEQNSNQGQDR